MEGEQKAPVVSVEMSAVGVVVCYAIEPSHPSQFKSFVGSFSFRSLFDIRSLAPALYLYFDSPLVE